MDRNHRSLGKLLLAQPVHVARRAPFGVWSKQAQLPQDLIEGAVDVVQHPAPADHGQRERGGPRQQDQEAHEPPPGEVGREHQHQDVGQHDHDHLRDEREADRVPQGRSECPVVPDHPEIVETDPVDALVADGDIAQAVRHGQDQGNADQRKDVDHRREQHQRTEESRPIQQVPAAVFLDRRCGGGLPGRRGHRPHLHGIPWQT